MFYTLQKTLLVFLSSDEYGNRVNDTLGLGYKSESICPKHIVHFLSTHFLRLNPSLYMFSKVFLKVRITEDQRFNKDKKGILLVSAIVRFCNGEESERGKCLPN